MKEIRLSFLHMLKLIRRDLMLFAACLAPLLAGVAIKFGVPAMEKMLIEWTGKEKVISGFYGLFDIFFVSISPVMFCFIAAMVILEERDDHITYYLFVTKLGRNGYFLSRIIVPSLLSFAVTGILFPVFGLTSLPVLMMFSLLVVGTLQGIIIALLIINFSKNKLEGMAVTKLSTLIIMGAVVAYFVPEPTCYLSSFLPAFWMGKAVYKDEISYMIPAVVAGGIWLWSLYRKYKVKNL